MTLFLKLYVCTVIINSIAAMEDIEELVLVERVETVMPIIYILCFLMAFYGPNAEILGGVKASFWHYRGYVSDINPFLENLFLFLFVDFCSGIINGLAIWKFCKINPLKMLMDVQNKYWVVMAVQEAFLTFEVKLKAK